jgi:hypothetical protein
MGCNDYSNNFVMLPGFHVREGEPTYELAKLYEEMKNRRNSLINSSKYFAEFSVDNKIRNENYIYSIHESYLNQYQNLDLTSVKKYKIGSCNSYGLSEAELNDKGIISKVICKGMLLELELELLKLKNKYSKTSYSNLAENVEVKQVLRHKAQAIEKHSEFLKPIRQLDLGMIELLHEMKMIIGSNEYANGGNKDLPEKINLLLQQFNIEQYEIDKSNQEFKESVYEQYWNLK